MSKDGCSSRLNSRRSSQFEASENEFDGSLSSAYLPPPRAPLNAIQDPSQRHSGVHVSDLDAREKSESVGASRPSDKKVEAWHLTPRAVRGGKQHSEPSSAQSTPARATGSRASLGGAVGGCAWPRGNDLSGHRRMSLYSGASRGFQIANAETRLEVPHFELEENSSFWNDNNVQVLIRIRPLSDLEKVSQGYGRCIRQDSAKTLVWLGYPETRFTFDHIACETISQENLFRAAGLPMVENCLSGYNSCMFAYGQTGSGKTYTMMGDIYEVEGKLKEGCGITPRIFEYLFARIRMDEESRKEEKLTYSCKCSFLEIYNEQITDLLEPSSTNLQLREDMKKGVYVENLKEYKVGTVRDIVKLLSQGAANRKIAATHMNSESSRSHSVLTCIIESHWEKDSMSHFRFARLNLVDLAGSERQKSSAAEGERLKEAANINKSLSTLGLVIMSLVDLAHGKHRHVPYRDSRLTFLLQDSLGGNSKTMIIANVSPSTCSANETLSTLKFAQRAKLIQNNAKVNEDASGDISALQRQIQQLKGQLSFLMKHQNPSRCLSYGNQCLEDSTLSGLAKQHDSLGERTSDNHKMNFTGTKKDVKCSVATLIGSLRRERMLEIEVKKLKDEIEHLKCLAHEREEKAKHNDMTLKFREEKIKRLESLVDDKVTSEKYLVEENKALLEEINLLRERIDQNPELKQFAVENNRLIEQLQLYQDFYGPRERDILLAELSDLRSQLLEMVEEKSTIYAQKEHWDLKDFEDCRKRNARLMRKVEELPTELNKYLCSSQVTCDSAKLLYQSSNDPEEVTSADKYSLLEEMISIGSDSSNNMINSAHEESPGNRTGQSAGRALDLHCSNLQELSDARMLIESMESEQVHLIEKLQHMQEENHQLRAILEKTNKVDSSLLGPENQYWELAAFGKKAMDVSQDIRMNSMQVKRERIMLDLETANYEGEQVSQLFGRNQAEIIMEQVEMETARTILQLQDEVASLQLELHEKLSDLTQENARQRDTIAAKEDELMSVTAHWEKAILELTNFLLDGTRSLKDASGSIPRIAGSFPGGEVLISEQVERAAQACIEKEETILLLQESLENAQKIVWEMELKLSSLKGATMSLSGSQHRMDDESTTEAAALNLKLDEKTNMIKTLQTNLKHNDQISEAEKRVNAALPIVRWLSDCHDVKQRDNSEKDIQLVKTIEKDDQKLPDTKADADALILENAMAQLELARLGVLESKYAIDSSYAGVEMFVFSLQSEIQESFDEYKVFVHDLMRNCFDLKLQLKELRRNAVKSLSLKEPSLNMEDQCHMHRLKDGLAEINIRLNDIKNWVDRNLNLCSCSLTNGDVSELDESSSDSSTSSTDFSAESLAPDNESRGSPSTYLSKCNEVVFKQPTNSDFQDALQFNNTSLGAIVEPSKSIVDKDKMILCTRKELETTLDAFNKQYALLVTLFDAIDMGACPDIKGTKHQFECPESKGKNEGDFCNSEGVTGEKFHYACSFLVRFEQANATMKEADLMLNELLKANENAKNLAEIWRQTSEALIVERENLIQEIQQLKSSMKVIEGENQSLNEHIHSAFVETANSLSLLEGEFLQMQKHVEDMFKALECDVLSMGQALSSFIGNSTSSMEDIATEIMQRGFAVFVLWHCYLGKLIHRNGIPRTELGFHLFKQREYPRMMEDLQTVYFAGRDNHINTGDDGHQGNDRYAVVKNLRDGEVDPPSDCLKHENLLLKNELERKEVILQGLLFDLSMLQEAASHTKDIKDEMKLLQKSLSKVQSELDNRMSQLNNMTIEYKKLESLLADTDKALKVKILEIEQAKDMIDALSEQNEDLRTLLKDLYVRKSEAEEQLDEQREVVKGLEEEILHLTSTMERKVLSSVESIQDNLKLVMRERDQLHEQVGSLTNKLELACSLADENEAIAIEARQESEASRSLAEQKEEETKILEHSVEELEHTINVLEKKVYEMDQDVEKHRIIRDSLEKELQGLRKRLATVESFTENQDLVSLNGCSSENYLPRNEHPMLLELLKAYRQIKSLEEDRVEQEREIKQCRECISELVLHGEAQASLYQQKYKTLETMVHEIKADLSASTAPPHEKHEKSLSRPRGSSSPFRCISSLIQQTNLENNQELSVAKLHIQELEALAASRQQEVCMLNSRLAAAESMTHDVIRDLLGVKLDMTNYANLIEQHEVQKLVEVANKQTLCFHAKEQEAVKLRKQIDDLVKERESCMMEVSRREADLFATQMTLEQLRQRDQLLLAQNEMLKMDKTNLNRKVAELDEMVKTLCAEVNPKPLQHKLNFKDNGSSAVGAGSSSKRSVYPERPISRRNNELSQYQHSRGTHF